MTTATKPVPAKRSPARKKPAAEPAPARRPRFPLDGPNARQRAILACLAELPKGNSLDRHGLSDRSGVHINWVVECLGAEGGKDCLADGRKKLIPAGLARAVELDVHDDGRKTRHYQLTAAGYKLAAKLAKEAKNSK